MPAQVLPQRFYFLPGWGLGSSPLQNSISNLNKALSSINSHCIAELVDLPGYDAAATVNSFEEAVEQILDKITKPCALGGWSLGGMLSLAAAVRAPGIVQRLVLLSTTPCFVARSRTASQPRWPCGQSAEALNEFARNVFDDFDAMLPRFINNFNRGDIKSRLITRQLIAGLSQQKRPADKILQDGLRWLKEVDLRPLLGQVKSPTLIMHGDSDPLTPPAAAKFVYDTVRYARLEWFAKTAHCPFLAHPQRFTNLLSKFLTTAY